MRGPCCLQRAWKAMSLRGCERKLTSACGNASFLDEFHAPFLLPRVAHGLLFNSAVRRDPGLAFDAVASIDRDAKVVLAGRAS